MYMRWTVERMSGESPCIKRSWFGPLNMLRVLLLSVNYLLVGGLTLTLFFFFFF
ncbi:unnamed protein product [Arabidopsis halleri]